MMLPSYIIITFPSHHRQAGLRNCGFFKPLLQWKKEPKSVCRLQCLITEPQKAECSVEMLKDIQKKFLLSF